ncbi:oxidoreductase [Mesorhizobium sangaii]|uniref:NADP-dependent 3-hydroxy acid dehydrogenase YdfG n=1 Tax=Mesorhizobium sangaii TaxID=505389 RepID=A0A841PBV2_9HYPH|nr:oxidoreductase [Mesorhizobium sangaii]MBB6407772.1 NADP-dependent 3-hydroxy acid dehydrogenase YdfG [Mesorhizobium sangaii]
MPKTWFITGCSTGFGRAIAQHLLANGHNVAVTARNPAQVEDLVARRPDAAVAIRLDVTDAKQIDEALEIATRRFGAIDVLVNNAGVGYFGSFEDSDLAAVHAMFDLNVWGLVNMTRAVLPAMRQARAGTIVNISSIGGLRAFPSLSFYAATKHAVEAISESLSAEVSPLGLKVLIVEPSAFRTDWAGRSAAEAANPTSDYDQTAGAVQRMIRSWSGNQAGDPARAAAAIVRAVEAERPPLRLLLGRGALAGAREKLETLKVDFDAWAVTTEGADFPGTEPT